MNNTVLLFLFYILSTQVVIAQKDSLFQIWNNESVADTIRFKAMDDIIWNYYLFSSPDSALFYADKLIHFSNENDLAIEKGRALSLKGSCYFVHGDFIQAINFYEKSINVLRRLGEDISSPLNNLGACYVQIGDYNNAINTFEKGLKILEDEGDWRGLAGIHSNIGTIYLKQELYNQALERFKISLGIRDSIGDQRGMSESLSNIGIVYAKLEKYDSAISFHERSLEIDSSMNNKHGMISCYLNIASVNFSIQKYDRSKSYIVKGLNLAKDLGDKKSIINANNQLGRIYLKQDKLKKAQISVQDALNSAEEINFLDGIKTSTQLLYTVYKKQKQHKLALQMHEKYISIRDTLKQEEFSRNLIQQEYQHKYDKKASADSLIQLEKTKLNNLQLEAAEAKTAKKELELKSKNNQLIYLIVGLLLVGFFAFFIFNRFKVTQKQKILIDEQQKKTQKQKEQITSQHQQLEITYKEISDSILYAKRLQEAILPKRNEIDINLKDNFVLFRPKDVVSGDFYWFEQINNTSYIAAADCTGHGVPGAMVSVVCSNALSRSLLEFNKTHPNEILDSSLAIIVDTFARSGDNVRDGMDVSLCSISGMHLEYAGANNPLWIIRNKDLIELKADKQAVGATENIKPFTLNEFRLELGDVIYMFSDGFADQFGGEKGKKFKTKSLRELLLSIHHLEMKDQEKQLSAAFENWKGSHDQLDDVCVIGLRV